MLGAERLFAGVAVAVAATSGWANAAVLTQQRSFGPASYVFGPRSVGFTERIVDVRNAALVFDRFDPALGTLTGVRLDMTSSTTPSFLGTSNSPGTIAGVNANITTSHRLTAPSSSIVIECGGFFNQSGTFNSTTPSLTFVYGTGSCAAGPQAAAPAGLPMYAGTGTVSLSLRMEFAKEVTVSSSGMTYHFTIETSSTANLVYEYVPVPSPGAPAAFLMLAMARSRRRCRADT